MDRRSLAANEGGRWQSNWPSRSMAAWPAARCEAGSVRIRYNCGYGGTSNGMLRQFKTGIMLGVRAW
ncbi:hypothetical protein ACSHT2_08700 [Bradyrhizobium sp. PUT101]|uniref:hypothetical protein n=1 Tax=Bradyrhizobium sp. PUT101 TaxID=3447427 RepID=UPI003F86A41A